MRSYTYSEARQNFAKILARAMRDGSVRIRRRNGQTFIIKPEPPQRSPLDVPGVNVRLSVAEIVSSVHEGRRTA